MERQIRSAPAAFRAKRDESGKRQIEGYFSVFDDIYELPWGDFETVDPAAFDGALNDDVRALIDHETRLVIGRTAAGTLTLRVDEKGLFGSIEIN